MITRRACPPPAAVAGALLGAWSDEAVDRRAVDVARVVGGVRAPETCSRCTRRSRRTRRRTARRRGGCARARAGRRARAPRVVPRPRRYKLGWKNHALLAPLPAMYSPVFRGGFRPSGRPSRSRATALLRGGRVQLPLSRRSCRARPRFQGRRLGGRRDRAVRRAVRTRLPSPTRPTRPRWRPRCSPTPCATRSWSAARPSTRRPPTSAPREASRRPRRGGALRLLVDGASSRRRHRAARLAARVAHVPRERPRAPAPTAPRGRRAVIAGHTCQVAFAGRPGRSARGRGRASPRTARLEADFGGRGVVAVELVDSG